MCHAGAPQFLWLQAVRYAAQQLNLWPSDARPHMTPVSLWTVSPGVAADLRVWGSLAHVRALGVNKLFSCSRACVFVLVYVDDLVFATPDRRALAAVKEELQKRHTCTDLGELQRYLGLQITRDRAARTITLTQSHMVEQILTRFRFPFSNVQLTPLAVDHGLTAPPSDEPFESSGPYPELVGCLMYPMTLIART
ncbi:unnamed protein product [Closterium sp. NIES-53]